MRIRSKVVSGLICAVLVASVVVFPTLAAVPGALDPPLNPNPQLGPSLGLLLSALEGTVAVDPESTLGQELARIKETGLIRISAWFAHELSPEEQAGIEAAYGVGFQEVGGQTAALGPFYSLLVPVGAVHELAEDELTVWLEAVWRPSIPSAEDQPTASPRIASSLGLLLSILDEKIPYDPDSSLGQELDRIDISGMVRISAHFEHELSVEERAVLEEGLGVEFQETAGELAHMGPFYDLLVPVGAVGQLANEEITVRLEAAWQPEVLAPLDLSITDDPSHYTYVNAPAVWAMRSPAAPLIPLTGQFVTIADFDTGVDVRHPAFLKGSYGAAHTTWDWNGDGTFTPGTDEIVSGVKLRFWDAAGDPNNIAFSFDVAQDWVYGDANSDWAYDWNEMIYMAGDLNGNGSLEAGEPLIERGTLGTGIPNSKILATLNNGGVERRRGPGLDLEQTLPDTDGHGTNVAGILSAGVAHWFTLPAWPLARRYTGMAPDADLLVADRINVPFGSYIPWAAFKGAKIMLYEYGGWVQEYLDGSSNQEQMMDVASSLGILQVVPAGNLHCGGVGGCNPRHLQYSLPALATFNHQFNVPLLTPIIGQVWTSMLWLHPANNLTVQVTTPPPLSHVANLPCAASPSGWLWVTVDGHNVGCERATDSPRGTALYNIAITRGGGVQTGNWSMAVSNPSAGGELVNFYIADQSNTWSGGAGWINAGGGQERHTATWPSTCDTCLTVASYATRANFTGTVGDLSYFSGRGPRFFDGARIVDVAAPGHFDIITPESQSVSGNVGSYDATFGGTSAAAPHVVGMAALLYQYAANVTTPAHVAWSIMDGARADTFTGPVPNDDWGYGKLAGPAALDNMMIHDLGDAPTGANNAGLPMDAYPGVQASFPTVYSATVPGPIHWWAGSVGSGPWDVSLGPAVSSEREADSLFDEDLVNNIQPALGQSDLDAADDGVPFPGSLDACTTTAVEVTGVVTNINLIGPPPWVRYVNVWADWNADGDWGDLFTCTAPNDAPEWISQNSPVTFTVPGPFAIPVPVMPYRGGSGGDPLWIRVSVSDQPAPVDPGTGRADGRGPALGYLVGETEDYLYPQTDFEVAPPVCPSSPLTFTHAPTSSWPVAFVWDFGDGAVETDPGVNPTHSYEKPGKYTVTLTGTLGSSPFSVYTRTAEVKVCFVYLPVVFRNWP